VSVFPTAIVPTALVFPTDIIPTVLVFPTDSIPTVLVFPTEIVPTVLVFPTEIVFTVLVFRTEIVLTVLIFLTETVLTVLTFLIEIFSHAEATRFTAEVRCGTSVKYLHMLHIFILLYRFFFWGGGAVRCHLNIRLWFSHTKKVLFSIAIADVTPL
jgi:hypothetical protein